MRVVHSLLAVSVLVSSAISAVSGLGVSLRGAASNSVSTQPQKPCTDSGDNYNFTKIFNWFEYDSDPKKSGTSETTLFRKYLDKKHEKYNRVNVTQEMVLSDLTAIYDLLNPIDDKCKLQRLDLLDQKSERSLQWAGTNRYFTFSLLSEFSNFLGHIDVSCKDILVNDTPIFENITTMVHQITKRLIEARMSNSHEGSFREPTRYNKYSGELCLDSEKTNCTCSDEDGKRSFGFCDFHVDFVLSAPEDESRLQLEVLMEALLSKVEIFKGYPERIKEGGIHLISRKLGKGHDDLSIILEKYKDESKKLLKQKNDIQYPIKAKELKKKLDKHIEEVCSWADAATHHANYLTNPEESLVHRFKDHNVTATALRDEL